MYSFVYIKKYSDKNIHFDNEFERKILRNHNYLINDECL